MRDVCIVPVNLIFRAGCIGYLRASPSSLLGTEPPLHAEYDAGWLPGPVWIFWKRVNIMFMGIEPRSLCSSTCTISLSRPSCPGSMFSRNKF